VKEEEKINDYLVFKLSHENLQNVSKFWKIIKRGVITNMNKHLKVKKSLGETSVNDREIQIRKNFCKLNKITAIFLIIILLIIFEINISGCNTSKETLNKKYQENTNNLKPQKTLEEKYQDSAKNPPEPIYPTQASSIETLEVRFRWSMSKYSDYYQIEIQDSNWEIIVLENTRNSFSEYSVSNKLKDSSVYYWHVRAHYPSNIWSPWSNKNWFSIQTIESKRGKFNTALSKLYKEHDDVENIDWYYDKDVYNITDSKVYLYLGKTDNNIWLRFVISHTYSSNLWWLFIKSYTFNIDGEKYYITPDYSDIKRDNSIYSMWEIYDYNPTDQDIIMIEKIIKSKKALLRCVGENKVSDREITYNEKKGLENILDAYRLRVKSFKL
jgi:hypothetical protein